MKIKSKQMLMDKIEARRKKRDSSLYFLPGGQVVGEMS
jgi:hypothetical protein